MSSSSAASSNAHVDNEWVSASTSNRTARRAAARVAHAKAALPEPYTELDPAYDPAYNMDIADVVAKPQEPRRYAAVLFYSKSAHRVTRMLVVRVADADSPLTLPCANGVDALVARVQELTGIDKSELKFEATRNFSTDKETHFSAVMVHNKGDEKVLSAAGATWVSAGELRNRKLTRALKALQAVSRNTTGAVPMVVSNWGAFGSVGDGE